jgi:hypothetical protein
MFPQNKLKTIRLLLSEGRGNYNHTQVWAHKTQKIKIKERNIYEFKL